MTKRGKVIGLVGVVALLLSLSNNMQVSALSPEQSKSNIIKKDEMSSSKENIKVPLSKEQDKTPKKELFETPVISLKDSTIYVGDRWTPADNFVWGTDSNGHPLSVNQLEITTRNIDTSKAGTYHITYTIHYNFLNLWWVSEAAYVTVKEDSTAIHAKDSTLYVGEKWKKSDNFVDAVNQDGDKLDIKDIKVSGHVNTNEVGTYKVTYETVNHANKKISTEATVQVVNDNTVMKVRDSKLYVGDKWKASDNFISASGKDGKSVGIDDIDVKGSVNTEEPGIYKVTYTILDSSKKEITQEAVITVVEDQTNLKVKDSVLKVGNKWQEEDNFVSATDKDGKAIDIKDVIIEGDVDTNKLGDNKVLYTILNHAGEKVSKEAMITIVADQTDLEVKDSTITLGDKWQASDNLVKATDADGKKIGIKDIDVKGDVDTAKIGKYEVTYTVSDSNGTKVIREANVTVKDKTKAIVEKSGNDKELPKTGFDISIVITLVVFAGLLGSGSIYLIRRQRQE